MTQRWTLLLPLCADGQGCSYCSLQADSSVVLNKFPIYLAKTYRRKTKKITLFQTNESTCRPTCSPLNLKSLLKRWGINLICSGFYWNWFWVGAIFPPAIRALGTFLIKRARLFALASIVSLIWRQQICQSSVNWYHLWTWHRGRRNKSALSKRALCMWAHAFVATALL